MEIEPNLSRSSDSLTSTGEDTNQFEDSFMPEFLLDTKGMQTRNAARKQKREVEKSRIKEVMKRLQQNKKRTMERKQVGK